MHKRMIHKTKQIRYNQFIKRNLSINDFSIGLKNINDDFNKKDSADFFNTNLKNIGDELNNKKDTILSTSSEVAMDNILKSLKMVEDRVRHEKLNDIQVNVSIALGPITIGLSKTISTNNIE